MRKSSRKSLCGCVPLNCYCDGAVPCRFGITDPISHALPTAVDKEQTAALDEMLRANKLYEDEDEAKKREGVLGTLNNIVQEWVRDAAIEQGMPEHLAMDTGARIFTFGSYRLGVHGNGTDMDTLCLAPKHVDRARFFSELKARLEKDVRITKLLVRSAMRLVLLAQSF